LKSLIYLRPKKRFSLCISRDDQNMDPISVCDQEKEKKDIPCAMHTCGFQLTYLFIFLTSFLIYNISFFKFNPIYLLHQNVLAKICYKNLLFSKVLGTQIQTLKRALPGGILPCICYTCMSRCVGCGFQAV